MPEGLGQASLETPVAQCKARCAWEWLLLHSLYSKKPSPSLLCFLDPAGDAGGKAAANTPFLGKWSMSVHCSGTAWKFQSQHAVITWESSWYPIRKDTAVTVPLFIGICLYRWTAQKPKWVSVKLSLDDESFATSYPIVPQFFWIKNRWRYSFTSFFPPAISVLTPKWFMVLIIFLERLELALGLEEQKILRKQELFRFASMNGTQTLVCICVSLRNEQCNFSFILWLFLFWR